MRVMLLVALLLAGCLDDPLGGVGGHGGAEYGLYGGGSMEAFWAVDWDVDRIAAAAQATGGRFSQNPGPGEKTGGDLVYGDTFIYLHQEEPGQIRWYLRFAEPDHAPMNRSAAEAQFADDLKRWRATGEPLLENFTAATGWPTPRIEWTMTFP